MPRSDAASKHAIVGLGRTWAHWLAPHNIRVNSVHPAGANTPMVVNEAVAKPFASAPASSGADVGNLLDVQFLEAVDVSNAIAWLVSDEARPRRRVSGTRASARPAGRPIAQPGPAVACAAPDVASPETPRSVRARPAPTGRPAGLADAAADGDEVAGQAPPGAGRGPVRSGVLGRLPAQPARGGRRGSGTGVAPARKSLAERQPGAAPG